MYGDYRNQESSGPTLKRAKNWAKLGQFPSWIKLRKPRGPPLRADAVAKVNVDLAAATLETNKPLTPSSRVAIPSEQRGKMTDQRACRSFD